MKVIYTDQSLDSLHEGMDFLLEDLGIPMEKVSEIKTQLLDKADSLALNPYKGQKGKAVFVILSSAKNHAKPAQHIF
jgi:hypothetical protein